MLGTDGPMKKACFYLLPDSGRILKKGNMVLSTSQYKHSEEAGKLMNKQFKIILKNIASSPVLCK